MDVISNSLTALPDDPSAFAAVGLDGAYSGYVQDAYAAFAAIEARNAWPPQTLVDLQGEYRALSFDFENAYYPARRPTNLQGVYAALTPLDLQIGLQHLNYQVDYICLGTNDTYEVSGRFLRATTIELKSLQQKQMVLDKKIASMRSHWASYFETVDAVTVLLETIIIEKLHMQLVRNRNRIKTWIVRLSRGRKTIKRLMRQRQRAVFVGLTPTKKDWYLLHGAHPPEAQSLHTELLFGGVRA